MELLLDTHALLWYLSGDKKLSKNAAQHINDQRNHCYVSISSLWEIAVKLSLKKLEIKGGFETVEDFLRNNDFEIMPIDVGHTKLLLTLDYHHRDPFDRMMIVQALSTQAKILTKDDKFNAYDVETVW